MQGSTRAAGLLAVMVLVGAGGRAQRSGRVVLPAPYATVEGEASTGMPFGASRSARLQHWYAPALLPARASVRGIAFRPDGGRAMAAKRVEVEVELSTSRRLAREVTQYFRMNLGLDVTQCVARRKVSLPAFGQAHGPRPFSVRLAFDRPFAYAGARGGLLVDLRVHSSSSARYDLDMGAVCFSETRSFGLPACPGSRGRPPEADVAGQALSHGRPFLLRLRGMLPAALGGVFLGSRESGVWNGLRLPHSLAREGAPGCALDVDVLVATYGVASSAGELHVAYRLPPQPWLAGRWLRYQGVAVDRRANALGIVTTTGRKTRVCDPFPIVRVTANRATARIGTVGIGQAAVCELDLR